MHVLTTAFRDLVILEPVRFMDERGFFMESYNQRTFAALGLNYTFIQDNQSYSKYGVLRGLHFQRAPYAQTKLVLVLSGRILDVVVDLRAEEPTYGRHFSIELSSENRKQLLVPKGFAHGFVVLSDHAEVLYKCDEYYNKDSEGGIRFDDPSLSINWFLGKNELIVSRKDLELSNMVNVNGSF
jgi:dTDP-4-dehydrorhamnose 3,5-epimerase